MRYLSRTEGQIPPNSCTVPTTSSDAVKAYSVCLSLNKANRDKLRCGVQTHDGGKEVAKFMCISLSQCD